MRVFVTISPISLVHSKSREITRSKPSWRIAISFPPERCFLSSMQNIGGCWGFSNEAAVRFRRALTLFADSTIFFPPSRNVRRETTISSREG